MHRHDRFTRFRARLTLAVVSGLGIVWVLVLAVPHVREHWELLLKITIAVVVCVVVLWKPTWFLPTP